MKTCSFCGKTDKRIVKDLCMKHYMQQRLCGELKRTKFDKNELIIQNGYAEMLIYNGKGQVKSKTLIDVGDIEKVSKYKWSLDGFGYIVNARNKLRLNRYLMNPSIDLVVDHINRNPLDNRKSNLRCVTQQENTMNRDLGNQGVKQRGKRWIASGKHKGKKIHLGTFDTKDEAMKAKYEFYKSKTK